MMHIRTRIVLQSCIDEAGRKGSFALFTLAQLLVQKVDLFHLGLKSLASVASLSLDLRIFELRLDIERALALYDLAIRLAPVAPVAFAERIAASPAYLAIHLVFWLSLLTLRMVSALLTLFISLPSLADRAQMLDLGRIFSLRALHSGMIVRKAQTHAVHRRVSC